MTECVITGVVLIEDDVAYNGDLFIQCDTYIVNCNEQSAHVPDLTTPGLKWIRPNGDYWTRKGVYVFDMFEADHSVAALEYMGK